MSKVLSDLINQPHHLVGSLIENLEKRCAYSGEDIRLIEEVKAIVRRKTAELGLDPIDTNPQELYHALKVRFSEDCRKINQSMGHNRNSTASQKAKSLTVAASVMNKNLEVWSIKHSSAKKILRVDPPKALMRQLGYRSLDSMLKHEKIEVLYASLAFTMSEHWQESFWRRHNKLTPLDFESRKIQFITPAYRKWQPLLTSSPAISTVSQLGAVIIWPTAAIKSTDWLASFVLAARAAESARFSSLVCKAQQAHGDFPKRVSNIWSKDFPHLGSISGHSLHWHSFFSFIANQPLAWHPDLFEPYLSADEFNVKNLSRKLAQFHPKLSWWADTEFAFLRNGGQNLSLNIVDIAKDHVDAKDFHNRNLSVGRQSFWNELIERYLAHPHIYNSVLQDIESNLLPVNSVRLDNEYRVPSMAGEAVTA